MILFRFIEKSFSALLDEAEMINGATSVLWVERFRGFGEFEIRAGVGSNLHSLLPIGSFVSHADTREVMIVENHEITEVDDAPSEIKITGRSYETFLENRIVGANRVFPIHGELPEYVLADNPAWKQARILLEDHITVEKSKDYNNGIPFLAVIAEIPFPTPPNVTAASIKRGTVYDALLDILALGNLGIKTIRPFGYGYSSYNPKTIFAIHGGVDRSATVVFSHNSGDIKSADYLWSNKNLKTDALVTSKWAEFVVTSGNVSKVGYKRRMMHVDAKDIDESFTEMPPMWVLDIIKSYMYSRVDQILSKQKEVSIAKVEASREANTYKYGVAYNVGDLVTVHGDYNATAKMRVSEYVRIMDETGDFGYPTLSSLDEGV